jgi:hypothetical protein
VEGAGEEGPGWGDKEDLRNGEEEDEEDLEGRWNGLVIRGISRLLESRVRKAYQDDRVWLV